jgi:hypothetical protein
MVHRSPVADPTATLSLKIMHHTSVLPHQCLGSVSHQINTLLRIKELLEMHEDFDEGGCNVYL